MTSFRTSLLAAAALIAAMAAPALATVNVTISNPGSATANVTGFNLAVNNLDNASNGLASFGFTGSSITATNDGFINIAAADVYGGAGGVGSYGSLSGDATLSLSGAINYFGIWGSALDGNNSVALYNDDTLLGTYALQQTLQSSANYSSAYYTNPYGGGNSGEQYAFFNFVSDTAFNKVKLIQNGGGGFEFDNLTIGSGVVSAAPEPTTWALMLIGFGAIGWSARNARRPRAATLVAQRAFA